MRGVTFAVGLFCFLVLVSVTAAHGQSPPRTRILSLIVEQRINEKPYSWWTQDKDLSLAELACAGTLSRYGIDVLRPSELRHLIQSSRIGRHVLSPRNCAVKNLGHEAGARFILSGRALVSKGRGRHALSRKEQYVSVSAVLTDVITGSVASRLVVWGRAPLGDQHAVDAALRDAGERLGLRIRAVLEGKGEN